MAHDRLFVTHHHRLFLPYRGWLVANRLRGAHFLGAQRLLEALGFAPLVLPDRLVARLLVTRPGGRGGASAIHGRLLFAAGTIAAMAPAAAAVLLAVARTAAVALRWPRVLLLFGPRLVRPRLVRPRLIRPRLLFRPRLLGSPLLLRPRLLLPLLVGPAIPALGPLAAVRPVAPLAAGLAIAPLLEAALLLAVAVLVAWRATVAAAVAPIPSLLITSRFATPRLAAALLRVRLLRALLRLGCSNGRRGLLRRGGGSPED
ncbi:MAG TPA: hypothetical protein VMV01_20180, partial [Planctomycetota bacterium]|nr:hypothetical protein [Planctomycetota bacterium]